MGTVNQIAQWPLRPGFRLFVTSQAVLFQDSERAATAILSP